MRQLWRRRFLRSEQGSVLIETALMLTIILLLMFGVVDMGRALYTANNLVSAAREGARFAATDNSCATIVADTKATVRARFSPFGGAALTDAQITVTVVNPSTPGFCTNGSIRVAIAYPFTWITPVPKLMRWTNGSTFTSTLHSQAEYRYEL
jgi:Flp pilus assembly protein TadG